MKTVLCYNCALFVHGGEPLKWKCRLRLICFTCLYSILYLGKLWGISRVGGGMITGLSNNRWRWAALCLYICFDLYCSWVLREGVGNGGAGGRLKSRGLCYMFRGFVKSLRVFRWVNSESKWVCDREYDTVSECEIESNDFSAFVWVIRCLSVWKWCVSARAMIDMGMIPHMMYNIARE